MSVRILARTVTFVVLTLLPMAAAAAQVPETATFYVVTGNDTLIVERMTRLPNRLQFQLFDTKRFGRVALTAELLPSALVSGVDVSFFKSALDSTPLQHTLVRFIADSAGFLSDGNTNWLHIGKNAIPYVNGASSLLEQLLIRAKSFDGASGGMTFLVLPGGPEVPVTVAWKRTDSAVVLLAGVTMRLWVSPIGRLLGGVIPAQNARILRGGATSGPAPGRKSYDAPPGAPYTAQEVVVHAKSGLRFTGTLTLPATAARSRVPAIVTITGSGSQDRDEGIPGLPKYALYRELADTLGRRGIAVLRLDDRGINGSDAGPPGATTADFADDIRAGVAFLRSRGEIDPKRIGLVGHSEGGYIGPMVAASDSAIAAVVIMAGSVSPGRELLLFQQRFAVDSMAHLLGQQREAALAQYAHNTDSVAAAEPWLKFFLDYDGAPTAARVHAPVLIVHGAKDYQVPVAEAEKTAAVIRGGGNRDVTVKVFPATNHLFVDDAGVGFSYEKLPSYAVRPEVLGTIADWLVVRLKP
jgi:dienelactone hydrolase